MYPDKMEFIGMDFLQSIYYFLFDNQLIEATVLGLSVIVSYIGIVISVKSARANVKDRATMTYLIERSKEQKFTDSVRVIFDLNRKPDVDIAKYAKRENNHTPEAEAIRYIANQFEYLAIGVNLKIFNEKMLIKATKTTTIHVFGALERYILAMREGKNKHTYQEFEDLAKRWKLRV